MKIYSPEYFDLEKCTYEKYKRYAAFIATRCFGWGLPTTIVVPIADSFNHNPKASNTIDIINKRIHLSQNKIYGYLFNFDADSSNKNLGDDDFYDKSASKFNYNLSSLYKTDTEILSNEEHTRLI